MNDDKGAAAQHEATVLAAETAWEHPLPEAPEKHVEDGLTQTQVSDILHTSRDKQALAHEHAWAPVVYGMPSPDLFESADRGEVILMGCVIEGELVNEQCRECGLQR